MCDYVSTVAPERLDELQEHYDVIRPASNDMRAHLAWFFSEVEDHEAFVEHADAALRIVQDVDDAHDDGQGDLARHSAQSIVDFYTFYTYFPAELRDQRMAENTEWWQHRTGNRVVYWAHNAHTANAAEVAVYIPPGPPLGYRAAGADLRQRYGRRYVSIQVMTGGSMGEWFDGIVHIRHSTASNPL